MALSTAQWLETYPGARAALSMIVDGLDTIFATTLMPGTYSGAAAPYDGWSDPVGGLIVGGTISQEIQLYTPDIQADTLTFTVVDKDGTLAGQLLREAKSTGNTTYLRTSLVAGATTAIEVKSTSGFAASGTIYIGGERIAYTGTTADTFTGITRAKFTVLTTSGGAKFSPGHLIGNNVTVSATTAPAVTDYPRTWYGRFVSLLMHFQNPLTGTYSLPVDSRKMWTGRLHSYSDNGDGTITITAKSALELLNRHLGSDQWKSRFNEGITVSTAEDTIQVYSSNGAGYLVQGNVAALTGSMTHEQLASAINAQLRQWNTDVSTPAGDMWAIALEPQPTGHAKYVVRLRANTTAITAGSAIQLRLHKQLGLALGWENADLHEGGMSTVTGDNVRSIRLERQSSSLYEAIAPLSPVVFYYLDMHGGNQDIRVSSEVNSFVTQASSTFINAPAACNGVVQITGGGYDAVYAVAYTSGSPSKIVVHMELDKTTGAFRIPGDPVATQDRFVRLGDATEAPEVKQVWYESGSAGTILLKGLLSTGGAVGYNHATYDVHTTASFGAAVPASLVDVFSFEEMDDVKIQLLIAEPKPFYEYMEQVLAISNRYVVWKSTGSTSQPKMTIVRPSLETTWQASWQLTEANKAGAVDGPERVRVSRAAEGVINRIVVKYGGGMPGNDADSAMTVTVDSIASQSDYGRKRTVTINAPTVTNAVELAGTTIGPALAYFSRPLAVAERSYNASLFRMAPGDTASLTDSYVTDPSTGTRGAVVYCWVLGTSFDLATGRGTVRVVFLPEKKPKFTGLWAPSARVDETAANAGYVVATRVLTCKPTDYAEVAHTDVETVIADATRFVVGDSVHIVSLDEAAPLQWNDVVAAQSGNTITLTTGLAGWDTAKRYVIEYRNIAVVANDAQRNHAFIADDVTLSTGYTTITPYEWGQSIKLADTDAINYSRGMFRPNTQDDDMGEPMSIHKQSHLVDAANNLLGYKTRQVLLDEYFATVPVTTSTTGELLFVGLVPLYGCSNDGVRQITVKLRVRLASGTSTYTVACSDRCPAGATWSTFSFPFGANTSALTSASTTDVWLAEITLNPSPFAFFRHGQTFTWVSVYASSPTGASTFLTQVIAVEAGL